jgi:hypothetical protein
LVSLSSRFRLRKWKWKQKWNWIIFLIQLRFNDNFSRFINFFQLSSEVPSTFHISHPVYTFLIHHCDSIFMRIYGPFSWLKLTSRSWCFSDHDSVSSRISRHVSLSVLRLTSHSVLVCFL